MPANIVVGSQWGDEGKGKIIDILASRAEVVVRSQGGNNAGHTVVNNGEVYKLHLIPSGILYPDTLCLIGAGVVLDPKDFISELDSLETRGISTKNLKIDPRAQIVMPWHIQLDGLSEKFRGNSDIGTTKRGIGPAYMDKYERCGIRMYDLCHPDVLAEKIKATGNLKNKIITAVYGGEAYDLDAVTAEYIEYGKRLASYMDDVSVLTYEADKAGKTIMFEGAQATLLDIDFGTYPYVTSSSPNSNYACQGSGLSPRKIDKVVSICKAYTTRVGEGPFPSELNNELGNQIREKGHEYGTVTKRPRRVGYLDLVLVKRNLIQSGSTSIALTLFDVLSDIDDLKICIGYELNGEIIDYIPSTIYEYDKCKPVYKDMKSFHIDENVTSFNELPNEAKEYIRFIEDFTGVKVSILSIGKDRKKTLLLGEI